MNANWHFLGTQYSIQLFALPITKQLMQLWEVAQHNIWRTSLLDIRRMACFSYSLYLKDAYLHKLTLGRRILPNAPVFVKRVDGRALPSDVKGHSSTKPRGMSLSEGERGVSCASLGKGHVAQRSVAHIISKTNTFSGIRKLFFFFLVGKQIVSASGFCFWGI